MKYGIFVLIFTSFLIQGFSQVHLTQTRVKYRKSNGIRIIKAITCDASGDDDATFKNYQKLPTANADWWLRFQDFKGQVQYITSGEQDFWQIDIGQSQLTATLAFSDKGSLEGWLLSSRTDTLLLSNFRPDVVSKSLISCSLGRQYPQYDDKGEINGYSLQKMLTFTQKTEKKANLQIEEAYSIDKCPAEFRVVAAFLATWILAREYGAH